MTRRCPICGQPLTEEAERFRPFCSKRCADIDLGRWLKGNYAIPAGQAEEDEQEDRDPPSSAGPGEPEEETEGHPPTRH